MINYPEVFETGKINYVPGRAGKLHACADVLCAWANCHAGHVHKDFGVTMAKISFFLGGKILPEEVSELSEKLLKYPIYNDKEWYMVPNLKGDMVKAQYRYYEHNNNEEFVVDGGGRLGMFDIDHKLVRKIDNP